MPLNPNRWTIKTQEALSAALEQAATRSHSEVTPDHILLALLGQEDGVVLPILKRAGVSPLALRTQAQDRVARLAKAYGGAEPQLGRDARDVLDAADRERAALNDEYLSTEHLLLALAELVGVEPRGPAHRPARRPRQPPGHQPDPRGQLPGPGEVRPRPHRDGPPGQARPGHRPRRGDPPRHPGPVPPHQEQPGPHRRAGRGQDRHRRGPGPAHRRGRRAREPEGPPHHRPRPGLDGGRRQVPRRVRGAAEGRPQGDRRRRRARSSPSSTRCTPSSAPARPRAPWTPPTCSSPCWPAASCA